MSNLIFKNSQKGVSIYLTILIMVILLSIGLEISAILIGQMRMIKGMEYSVLAFYAADTGIERALFELYKTGIVPPCQGLCSTTPPTSLCTGDVGEASYCVEGYSAGDINCPQPPNDYFCIKSVGIFKETRRAIEISR